MSALKPLSAAPDSVSLFKALEDASMDAKQSAAVLVEYFDAEMTRRETEHEGDVAVLAALHLRHMAYDIFRNIETIERIGNGAIRALDDEKGGTS